MEQKIKNEAAGTNCTICQHDFEVGDRIRGLKCLHLFHALCIDNWLTKRSGACPLCRIIQCNKEDLAEARKEDRDGYVPRIRNARHHADRDHFDDLD